MEEIILIGFRENKLIKYVMFLLCIVCCLSLSACSSHQEEKKANEDFLNEEIKLIEEISDEEEKPIETALDEEKILIDSVIPYNVPLEEIAERIEYVYAYENMVYHKTESWFEYAYGELGALPVEEDILISIYAVKGNRLLFLPEDSANAEILLNDMLCKMYYSEKEAGYLFYALIDWQLVDDGVPVNYYEGYYDYGIRSCIVGVKEVSEPHVIDYYQTDYQYEIDDLEKLGEVRVNFNSNATIELPKISINGNEYIDAMLEYMADVLRKKQQFGSYDIYLETYGRLHDKYGEGTYGQISGAIIGNGLEEYFYFSITDGLGDIDKECVFPTFYSGPVDESTYFVNHGYMANQPENLIQEIIELQRETVHLEVTEEIEKETRATIEHEISDYNFDIDFRTMSEEEAVEWINYVYNYGECFGMNELGYQAGELRKYGDADIVMYTWDNIGDIIYFIPKSMTNTTITSDSGEKYRVYVNKEGYMEFYCLERNRNVDKDGQLRTSLFMKSILDTEFVNNFTIIGEGKLQIQEPALLDVPKVAEDEYVIALEQHIEDMLKQEGKSGSYEMYVGEYEALARSKVCLSVALLGEEGAYYFRYMIVKSGEENYYFWLVGFGLNDSLEECEADRHYMNKVCIERTKQLERSKIVLDITP